MPTRTPEFGFDAYFSEALWRLFACCPRSVLAIRLVDDPCHLPPGFAVAGRVELSKVCCHWMTQHFRPGSAQDPPTSLEPHVPTTETAFLLFRFSRIWRRCKDARSFLQFSGSANEQ